VRFRLTLKLRFSTPYKPPPTLKLCFSTPHGVSACASAYAEAALQHSIWRVGVRFRLTLKLRFSTPYKPPPTLKLCFSTPHGVSAGSSAHAEAALQHSIWRVGVRFRLTLKLRFSTS
jgi:hypothetical protein